MTNKQILEKINQLTDNFQKEENNLKKFIILYEYMDFLKTNSKIKIIFEIEEENCKKTVSSMIDGSYTVGEMGVNKGDNFNPDENTNIFYSFLDYMYHAMKEYRAEKDKTKTKEAERKIDLVFKDPAQATLLIMSFSTLNKKITNQINKEDFKNESETNKELFFDKEKSILYSKGKKIKIKRKADFPLEHYILEYIFELKDKSEEAYFRDIAEEKLSENDYDGTSDWKKYYRACERLQEKVRIAVGIDDFLIFSTGKTANVKINKKYISLL
ncbi:hypothetical protein ISS03_03380 [Patescibacteria group bacterium]|nr:hypothetical protein [Patescibacteria group bacterium]